MGSVREEKTANGAMTLRLSKQLAKSSIRSITLRSKRERRKTISSQKSIPLVRKAKEKARARKEEVRRELGVEKVPPEDRKGPEVAPKFPPRAKVKARKERPPELSCQQTQMG